jgi:hypothetical protein
MIAIQIRESGWSWSATPLTLEGSVLTQNVDPTERTPLAGVTVTAMGDGRMVKGKSDATGYFSVTFDRGLKKDSQSELLFQKPGYKTTRLVATRPGDQLYIAQMTPLETKPPAKLDLPPAEKPVVITDVKVRYSAKDQTTIPVGSIAKQFSALNNGNVPCRNQKPCSPDGRWKATLTTLPLDAEERNQFRNVRVSCIAGPCRFTKIDSAAFATPSRRISVSVLNWSDTTDFLVEADVVRTMVTDRVRTSYPFVLDDTMNFALPPNSEGPAIEADFNGQFTVFPLGPDALLSWATCNVELSADGNQIFRCRLKPGYQF